MKRILFILFVCLPLYVAAQMVQPVHWSGEDRGDSVRIRATVDDGWHMSILGMGDFMFTQEFKDSFVMTVAKTDLAPIRFNGRSRSYSAAVRTKITLLDLCSWLPRRSARHLYALRVADHTDDRFLLLEERRRIEGCDSLWAEHRDPLCGIRIVSDDTLWCIGTQ